MGTDAQKCTLRDSEKRHLIIKRNCLHMKAAIYKTKDGYEIVNAYGQLFTAIKSNSKFIIKSCGTVNPDVWRGSGALVKGIPNELKQLFFTLNQEQNGSLTN